MPKNSSTATHPEPLVRIDSLTGIGQIPADSWNRLHGTHYPFLRHEFLLALEESGCASVATGWSPCHLTVHDDRQTLVGAMPLYRKTNSFGEFVFDWAWADAYRRSGLHYYPKLVSAIPYTPATSTRLLHAPEADLAQVQRLLLDTALALTRQSGASSLHLLFPDPAELPLFSAAGMSLRKDCQFHWTNRDYSCFEDFLRTFTAEKRKKARRERRRIAESGITFEHLDGHQIDDALWKQLMPLYASSFLRRGRNPYLNEDFSGALPRTCRTVCWSSWPGCAANRWPPPSAIAARIRCMAVTGAVPATSTACTSKPATTRASSTASPTACRDSSPAHRVSTSWRADLHPRRPGPPTGCRTRSLPPPSTAISNANARISMNTWTAPASMYPSARARPKAGTYSQCHA
jgi:hypothetical protein